MRTLQLLLLIVALLLSNFASATEYAYWPGREPANAPKTLLVKAGMPPEDSSYPRPTKKILEKWCKASGWTKDKPGHIIVSNEDFRSQPSWHILREPNDKTGIVTPEIVAEFLVDDMQKIHRLDHWWISYLEILSELGYEISVVAMDWELNFASEWEYDLNETGKGAFTMRDVVRRMSSWPHLMRQLPRLDMPSWNDPNIYGVRKNEQTMLLFNLWVAKKQSARLTELFVNTTTAYFPGSNVSNYNHIKTVDSPLISWPHGLPQGLPAVGNSAFLAYLSNDTGYRTNEDVKAAFGVIADPEECTVWVGHWSRNEGGWRQSKQQFNELNRWLIAQGVAVIVVY